MSCSSRAGRLRAIAPFATITLLLLSSSLVSAGPREDREAATAASEKASSSPAPAPDAAPSPSASAALGSGAPKNASFLFTITAKKATLEIDPKVRLIGTKRRDSEEKRERKERLIDGIKNALLITFTVVVVVVVVVVVALNLNNLKTKKKQRNDSAILKLLDANPHGERSGVSLFLIFTEREREGENGE